MDTLTIAFVFALFVAAAFLTFTIRRDFLTRQALRRDLQRAHPQPPRVRRRP